MIVHRSDGWHVLSEKGKNLGGPYQTQAEAKKRLAQVEFFKHTKGTKATVKRGQGARTTTKPKRAAKAKPRGSRK